MLLFYFYLSIFIFLLGHLHFFLHFSFTFMENLFKKHPIYLIPLNQMIRFLSVHHVLIQALKTNA